MLLDPAVGDSEILALLGLLQPDGYNPLVVLGSRFVVPAARQPAILALVDRPDALPAAAVRGVHAGRVAQGRV